MVFGVHTYVQVYNFHQQSYSDKNDDEVREPLIELRYPLRLSGDSCSNSLDTRNA